MPGTCPGLRGRARAIHQANEEWLPLALLDLEKGRLPCLGHSRKIKRHHSRVGWGFTASPESCLSCSSRIECKDKDNRAPHLLMCQSWKVQV